MTPRESRALAAAACAVALVLAGYAAGRRSPPPPDLAGEPVLHRVPDAPASAAGEVITPLNARDPSALVMPPMYAPSAPPAFVAPPPPPGPSKPPSSWE